MGKAAKWGLLLGIGAVAGYVGSLLVPDKTRRKQKKAIADYTQESVNTYRRRKTHDH